MERKKERKNVFFLFCENECEEEEVSRAGGDGLNCDEKECNFFGLPPTAQHRTRFLFSSCAILYFS
jgi:hypothetical protein